MTFGARIRSGCEEGIKVLKHKQIYFVFAVLLGVTSWASTPAAAQHPATPTDDSWL